MVVGADAETAWNALLDADLLEVGKRAPLAGLLGALRKGALPNRATRDDPPKTTTPADVAEYDNITMDRTSRYGLEHA